MSRQALAGLAAFVLVITGCSSQREARDRAEVTGAAQSPVPGRSGSTQVAGSGPVGSTTAPGNGPADASGSRGPRSLPPTFVRLELGSFPRPATEACADNTSIVRVAAGASIADAARSAASGTTILVEPGTYVEPNEGDARALVIEKPNVCIRAAGAPVVVRATADQTTGIAIAADDVVVDGIDLDSFHTGVGFESKTGQTIRRVTIERVRVTRPTGDFHEGIISFGDNREAPGSPPALDGLLILDVEIEGADLGISCNAGPCAHWWIERARVGARRTSEGSGADAFAIEDGRQIAVVDSTFTGAAADGIDTKADDVVVFGAQVRDVGRNAVKLWRGGDVIDTLVDGSDADAALVGHAGGRYRYLHLLVTRHGDREGGSYIGHWGFDERQAVDLEITNSIFFANSPGGFSVTDGSEVTIRRTIIDDGNAKLFDIGDVTVSVADRAGLRDRGWEADLIVADPRFTAPGQGDFRTRPDSPARDAGDPIPGLDRDITGSPRANGAAPDIGPYEA